MIQCQIILRISRLLSEGSAHTASKVVLVLTVQAPVLSWCLCDPGGPLPVILIMSERNGVLLLIVLVSMFHF